MNSVARLIEAFVPENYNLFLDLNRTNKTFSGLVTITGQALKETVALHQRDLSVSSVKVAGQEVNFQVDNELETVAFSVANLGDTVLEVAFSGNITDNMDGIYPSYYTLDGEKKELLGTQFESHFARQAFPSIDEPEAKATFDLSLKFDQSEGEIALSNMPEIQVENRKETGVWTFDTTPRMSSYLLAFVCGDLQCKTTHTKNGTLVGSYSTKAHSMESLDFSLEIAVKAIEFYEDYFGVAYPIPQSLHVALPDFSAGAMENWGLVTYREVYLVVDENSTLASRQQVALVIAHEVAHQWFGNLVTMKWWDDLWLNESFANMMEYVCVNSIKPEWEIFDDFQTSGVPLSLKRDATDGVQSVHVAVHHPDEINTLFDPAIVYAKGSRLMHMLRRWLGDADFAKGLGAYFEKHKYGNTVGTDLWNALGEASGRDVAGFMDSWLEQPGYPVLTVSVENDTLKIHQEQFFIGENEDKGRIWQVPLNSNWTGLPDTLTTETLEIPNYSALAAQNEGALRFNTENTAHYITNYQGELYQAIVDELAGLDKVSKLQILLERNLLSRGGRVSVASLLDLLPSLEKDTENIVLVAVADILGAVETVIDEDSEEEKAYKELVKSTLRYNYERLGFEKREGEAEEDEKSRQMVWSWMIYAGEQSAIDAAANLYKEYDGKLSSLPAALRALVLGNQVKNFESKEVTDTYLQEYIATNDGNYQRQLMAALSNTKNQETVEQLLVNWQDKYVVKPQDLSIWYFNFLGHDFTQGTVWAWAQENWDWIKSALGGDMSFDKFVIYPAGAFKTTERLAEYKAFFEPQLTDMAISRNISMGIKEIAARVDFIEREKSAVSQALLK